jgi:hypothetical protein
LGDARAIDADRIVDADVAHDRAFGLRRPHLRHHLLEDRAVRRETRPRWCTVLR